MSPLPLPNEAEDAKAQQNFREIQQYLVGTEEAVTQAQTAADLAAANAAIAQKAADSQPAVDVFKAAAQTVNSGVTALLAFDSEAIDVGGLHDNVTNNSRITVATSGLYLILLRVSAGGTGNIADIVNILVNGVLVYGHVVGADKSIELVEMRTLAPADIVEGQYINFTPNNATVTAFLKVARLSKGS